MHPVFDDQDAQILAERIARRELISGPRVGDFIYLAPDDLRRFTHAWDDGLQTTMRGNIDSSFYLFQSGGLSFSGSLDQTIPSKEIHEVADGVMDGRVWFFHHNHAKAHNGVYATVPCRVYERIAADAANGSKA